MPFTAQTPAKRLEFIEALKQRDETHALALIPDLGLLNFCAPFQAPLRDQLQPLHAAAYYGCTQVFAALLNTQRLGVSLEAMTSTYQSHVLHIMLLGVQEVDTDEGKAMELCQQLIRAKPELSMQRNKYGQNALHIAAQSAKTVNFLSVFLGHFDSDQDRLEALMTRNHDGNTPLHEAAIRGNAEGIQWLIHHGASAKALNQHAQTPRDVLSRRLISKDDRKDLKRFLLEHQKDLSLVLTSINTILKNPTLLDQAKANLDTVLFSKVVTHQFHRHQVSKDFEPLKKMATDEVKIDTLIKMMKSVNL